MSTPAPPTIGKKRTDSHERPEYEMSKASPASPSPGHRLIADPKAARARLKDIIAKRSFGRGEITLASGRKSDFYFNLKPTMLDAEGAALLAQLTLDALDSEELDYIGGLEMGAVPIAAAAAAVSALTSSPVHAFFVRKQPKEHGAKLLIEGLMKDESLEGKRVAVIEDVTTTGGSAMKAVEALKDAGAEIALVFTMVDRQEGAAETFAKAGIKFAAMFKAEEFLRA
jgi:orotate phosphoribosyltransferase